MRRLFLACALGIAAASAALAGTLKGSAVDDASGRPVGDLQVLLIGDSSRLVRSDSLGAFAVRGLSAGTWQLQVSAVGYEVWADKVEIRAHDTLYVQPRLVALPSSGSLACFVTTKVGQRPVRHAHVTIDDGEMDFEGVSEDDGRFWIDGLPTGQHRVRVTALGHDPVSLGVPIEADRATLLSVDLPPSGRKATAETMLPAVDTSAAIRFAVPDTAGRVGPDKLRWVRVEILQRDQPVRVLLSGTLVVEPYVMYWDGRDDRGRKLPAGAFRYRARIAERTFAEGDLILR